MKSRNIHCYYFSGTGNTLALLKRFSETVEKENCSIVIKKMEKDSFIDTDEDFMLGLVFPVAIQSTFPLVWDFVSGLPDGKGREVFMFDTMEIYSGGIVGPLKKVLTAKGYNCIAAREFKMSSSLNTKPEKVEKGKQKNLAALKQVEQFAGDLLSGKAEWKRVPIFSEWMRSISKSRNIWTAQSKKITISEDCILCLLCQKNCPTGAIKKDSRNMVIDHSLCISCMRCATNCPRSAILLDNKKLYPSGTDL